MGRWHQHQRAPPNSRAVQVYFSNPDLLWAAKYPAPRYGQGAFAAALRALLLQVAVVAFTWRWLTQQLCVMQCMP